MKTQTLTKRLIQLLLLFVLVSCEKPESSPDKFDRFMTELDCPVILVAKTDKAAYNPSVVVRDKEGRIRTFTFYKGLPQAIAESREIGDTLKPCIDSLR